MKPRRTALILDGTDTQKPQVVFRGEALGATLARTLGEYFDELSTIQHDGTDRGALKALAKCLDDLPEGGHEDSGQPDAHLFAVSSSTPFLQYSLMRKLYALRGRHDAVVVRLEGELKPLCGVYSKSCARLAQELSASENATLAALLGRVDTLVLGEEQLCVLDPLGLSYLEVEEEVALERCKPLLELADGALPPAFSFVAKSGTGKTTLLEKVLAEMTRRGWRVGSVKHDAHGFEIDHEGKDSWRLTQAGASPMIISSPGKLAMVRPNPAGEMPLEGLIRSYLREADIVITEGYKTGPLQKIEINRSERSESLLCVDGDGNITDERLVAVVSDAGLSLPVPLLRLDDVSGICDFIESEFLL